MEGASSPKHEPLLMSPSVYSSMSSSMQVRVDTPMFLYPEEVRGARVLPLRHLEEIVLQCAGKHNKLSLTENKGGLLKCDSGQLTLDDWVRFNSNNKIGPLHID